MRGCRKRRWGSVEQQENTLGENELQVKNKRNQTKRIECRSPLYRTLFGKGLCIVRARHCTVTHSAEYDWQADLQRSFSPTAKNYTLDMGRHSACAALEISAAESPTQTVPAVAGPSHQPIPRRNWPLLEITPFALRMGQVWSSFICGKRFLGVCIVRCQDQCVLIARP